LFNVRGEVAGHHEILVLVSWCHNHTEKARSFGSVIQMHFGFLGTLPDERWGYQASANILLSVRHRRVFVTNDLTPAITIEEYAIPKW